MSFCTGCGQPVQGGMRFCTNCGARLRAADSEDTPVTPAPAGPAGRAGADEPEAYLPPARGHATAPPAPPPPPPPPTRWPERPEPPTLTTGIPSAPTADPYSGWPPPPPPGGDFGPGDPGPGPGPYSDPEFGAEPPEPGRRRIPAWGMIAAAVVVVLAGLGGWYAATHHGSKPAASAQRPPSAKPSAGGAGSPAATSPSSQLASPTGAPTPSTPAATTAGGSSQVALGPGMSGQTAGSVAAFVGRYFAAINSHDYPAYISLFAPGADPGETAHKFQTGYGSTADAAETLVALASTPSGKTAASVTFNSHQSPASSATHTACTSWRITLYLVRSGTSYLISHPPASYHASFAPCS